jgi:hypothetical protein
MSVELVPVSARLEPRLGGDHYRSSVQPSGNRRPARTLTVMRDTDTRPPAPKKVTRRVDKQPFAGGDPLLDGVVRLFSIGLRHVYAALWRVGVLEVQA